MSAVTELGPVQRDILGVLTEHGGLTAVRLAEHLGRDPRSIHQSLRMLRKRGYVAVAGYQRRAGTAAGVYAITTAGRTAREAAKEAAA